MRSIKLIHSMDPIQVLLEVLKTRDLMEMSRDDQTRQVGRFISDT